MSQPGSEPAPDVSQALASCTASVAALRRSTETGGRLDLRNLAVELATLLRSQRTLGGLPRSTILALVDELEQLAAMAAEARDEAADELASLAARSRASRAYKGA